METPITAIDSHAHVFVRGLPLASPRRHAPDCDATPEEYLALLDAHGMSHAVLVQPSFLGTDNSYLLNAIQGHPLRLRGVAVVEPDISDDALNVLAFGGVRGLRLNLIGIALPDFAHSAWQRLFERVRALDWHVELHRESSDLAVVGQAVLDAGCKLVVDHFGRPTKPIADDMGFGWLLAAAASGRVWVKLSAAYRNWPARNREAAREAAQALLGRFSSRRLLWGSDWPHTQHREVIDFAAAHAALAEWVSDASERRRILVDTPAELFDFS